MSLHAGIRVATPPPEYITSRNKKLRASPMMFLSTTFTIFGEGKPFSANYHGPVYIMRMQIRKASTLLAAPILVVVVPTLAAPILVVIVSLLVAPILVAVVPPLAAPIL